jgi:SAM-dependent methyltransferase
MSSSRRAWWKKTFNQDYLDIYGPHLENRTALEIEGLLQLCALTDGAAILDLGCGHGRHSVELAKRGYQVTGLDQSRLFLDKAAERAQRTGVEVEWIQGCYTNLSWKNRFDLVISMYHSFGYCEDESEQEQLLRRVFRSIRPGGRFVIDLWGLQQLEPHLGQHRVELPEYLFEEEVTLSVLEQPSPMEAEALHRLDVIQALTRPGQSTKHYGHHIRLYTPSQLTAKLRSAGFVEMALWGSFQGIALDEGDRLIARARKPSA